MQQGNTIKLFILFFISMIILSESCSVNSKENKPNIPHKVISPGSEDPKTTKSENNRWEKTIQDFEKWDSKNSFPPDAVLFVGSSSIRQ